MPSMRSHPLNPRPPAVPESTPAPAVATRATPVQAAATGPDEDDSPAIRAARAGGFHESSYELQNGLQVSESEWPDDVTMPGALGDR